MDDGPFSRLKIFNRKIHFKGFDSVKLNLLNYLFSILPIFMFDQQWQYVLYRP